jgi:hypothetical protein
MVSVSSIVSFHRDFVQQNDDVQPWHGLMPFATGYHYLGVHNIRHSKLKSPTDCSLGRCESRSEERLPSANSRGNGTTTTTITGVTNADVASDDN